MGKNDVAAHHVKFYNPEARAIHCMALDRERNKLALTRSDNSIEIWDIQFMPYLMKLIAEDLESSIEDLKWYKGRLFSCGLQGYIVEYDCKNETILNSTGVTGGPAWCLDIHQKKKLAACGTEDGYINILEVLSDSLQHYKFLDKQQGRILCLSWDKPGEHLVTGSIDVIRVWNLETGHAIHKMTTGRSENKKETIVWSLAVTSDFTIISGDSRGSLCFWDGQIGTQITSFNSHKADILTVTLSKDESTVYCSGVDPVISAYGKVAASFGDSGKGRKKWAKGQHRKIHEHDVRALALTSDDKLFSGGIDGYLVLSSYPPRTLIKYPPLLKGPCMTLVPSKRYILLRYVNHLELWKLGQLVSSQDDCESLLLLSENQSQLLQLKAKEEFIISSSISVDGEYIAYSTSEALRFFQFKIEAPSIEKLPETSECGPCKLITFYKVIKRHFCAVVTQKNEINILEIDENGPDVIHTIRPAESGSLDDTISHLAVSPNGSYLLAADCNGNIDVWSVKGWSLYCTLPKNRGPVVAVAFNKESNNVVVAYTDRKVLEFSLKEKKYTQFSKTLAQCLPNNWSFPFGSITYDNNKKESAIIANDDSSICVFEENKMNDENQDTSKRSKSKNSNEEPLTHSKQPFHIIKKYKHIVGLDWLGKEEMVIVSVCPLKLAETLPSSLAKKFFGT